MPLMNTDPKCLALCNMKGGVGKTASAVNIAAGFAAKGKKTLLVDCDYQGNASDYLDVKFEATTKGKTLYEGIKNDLQPTDCILPTGFKNLDIIASNLDLSEWEHQGWKHHKISRWLGDKSIKLKYDYIVCDTRPQLGSLFDNVMAFAGWYLIPLFAEPDALSGLKIIFRALQEVKDAYNSELKSAGMLITKFNKSNATHRTFSEAIGKVSRKFDLPILATIPQSEALSGSVNNYTPLPFYRLNHKNIPIREQYLEIADSLMNILVHKKGRIPKVPDLKESLVKGVMTTMREAQASSLSNQRTITID